MTALQLALLPLIAGTLWYGLGGFVSRVAAGKPGGPISRVLWIPIGLGVSMFVTDGVSRLGIVLPFNAIIVVALALAGFWLQRRHLIADRRTAAWALAGVAPIAAAFGAITLTTGAVISGYLIDTNTGVHALGADYLLHHGSFDSIVPVTSDEAMITRFFVISSYPSGTHAIFGLLGALSGLPLLWVSTPLMGIALAATALASFAAARALGTSRLPATFAAVLASCGALALAFALTGQLKEIVVMPVLIAATAVALAPRSIGDRRAQAVVTAVICAGLYSALGIPGLAWAVPLALFVALRAVFETDLDGRTDLRSGLITLGLTAVIGAVLVAPLLPALADQLGLARSLSSSNAALAADPGNLLMPISKDHALGVWIAADHRINPTSPGRTGLLGGIVALLALAGLVSLARARRGWELLWVGGMLMLWMVLTARGTMWLDSKLVMLYGPVVAIVAARGLWELSTFAGTRLRPDPALAAVLMIGPIAGLALSGEALLQHTGTSTKGRFDELATIDKRFSGKGPVLLTEFDEYANYTLRGVGVSAPGLVEKGGLSGVVRDGEGVGYGRSADVGLLPDSDLEKFPLVATLDSPLRSSPGSAWDKVFDGTYLDVWQRDDARQERVVRHISVTGKEGQAFGTPRCDDVTSAAASAKRAGAQLVVRQQAGQTLQLPVRESRLTFDWQQQFAGSGSVSGDGRLVVTIPSAARGADRQLWLEGVVGRPLRVMNGADRQELGILPRRSGGDGNVVGPVTVPAGTEEVHVEAIQRQLRVGDKTPTVMRRFVLTPAGSPEVVTIDPDEARERLCGGSVSVDWIDVVRR